MTDIFIKSFLYNLEKDAGKTISFMEKVKEEQEKERKVPINKPVVIGAGLGSIVGVIPGWKLADKISRKMKPLKGKFGRIMESAIDLGAAVTPIYAGSGLGAILGYKIKEHRKKK